MRSYPWLRGIAKVVLSIIFLVGLAILSAWFIFYRQQMQDLDNTWNFVNEKPAIFWYSSLILFFLVALLAAIIWRPFLAGGIFFAIISVVTYINMQKYAVRAAPLLPEDFLLADTAGNLTQFVDLWTIVRLVCGVVLIVLASALTEHSARKLFAMRTREAWRKLPWWKRHELVPRLSFIVVLWAGLILVTSFITHHADSDYSEKVPWLDTEFVSWSQTENYEKNGFVLGFIYNLGGLTMQEPAGYSRSKIAEIVADYEEQAEQDTKREDLDAVVDNVVIILCETFYDPELLDKYYSHTGGDVLPNLRRIFSEYPSGYMYSPEYGGNTANIEFEVFSGLTNYWASTIQYTNTIPKLTALETIVSLAKNSYDFDTTAIHSYDGSMYKRNINYPKMGFDEFIDADKMRHTETEFSSEHINDWSVYQEILDLLKDNQEPQLIGAITMQNHAPYHAAKYPVLNFQLVSTDDVKDPYSIASNFESMHQGDQYIADFLDELDDLDERTVVLWFGDHAAGVLDKYIKSNIKEERDLAHLTPYFIYTNFELPQAPDAESATKTNKKLGFDFDQTSGIDLPTTSPNCLSNTMLNLLNAKKSALYYMLDRVCAETPILARSYLNGDEPEKTKALTDYELFSYDILVGKNYSVAK